MAAELKPARLRLLLRRRTSPSTQCMERLLRSELLPASVAMSACMPPPAGLPPLPPLSVMVKGAGVMSALLEMGAVAAMLRAAGELLPTWAAALSRPVAPPPALMTASLP